LRRRHWRLQTVQRLNSSILGDAAHRVKPKHFSQDRDRRLLLAALALDAELITDDQAILRSKACRMRALTGDSHPTS
jgi:hypothetical protein